MIAIGAYATLADAEAALLERPEPQEELSIVQDGEAEHPYRIIWTR